MENRTLIVNKPRVSFLAIASLILSLWPVGFIGGIVCGHLARRRIKRVPEMFGDSIARWGLGLSYTFLIVTAAFCFFIWAAELSVLKTGSQDGMTIPYGVIEQGTVYSTAGEGLDIKAVKTIDLVVNEQSYGSLEEGDILKVLSNDAGRVQVFVNDKRVYRLGCLLIKR